MLSIYFSSGDVGEPEWAKNISVIGQEKIDGEIKEISNENEMAWLTFTVMNAKTGAIVASANSLSPFILW